MMTKKSSLSKNRIVTLEYSYKKKTRRKAKGLGGTFGDWTPDPPSESERKT